MGKGDTPVTPPTAEPLAPRACQLHSLLVGRTELGQERGPQAWAPLYPSWSPFTLPTPPACCDCDAGDVGYMGLRGPGLLAKARPQQAAGWLFCITYISRRHHPSIHPEAAPAGRLWHSRPGSPVSTGLSRHPAQMPQ